MATTAERVAAWFIDLSHEKQNPVSNLKLQKLIYYSQAWHLAIFKKPLFDEEIEAWVHGPVVPMIFRLYRDFRWAPISRVVDVGVPAEVGRHLAEVWRVYGSLSAADLERLTHSEDPWRKARGDIAPDASSHCIISKASMQEYYSSRLNG